MHVIFARLVQHAGMWRTPVADHLPPGTEWIDDLPSEDSVLTIIPGTITTEVVNAIKADPNVVHYVQLPPAGVQLPAPAVAQIVAALAARGVTSDSLPDTPTSTDIVAALRRRIRVTQALQEVDWSAADQVTREARSRLARSGFNVAALDSARSETEAAGKVL